MSGIASPCVDVCRMDPKSGWCEGCLRTLDEIAAWGRLDDEGKRRVWALLPARRERLAATGSSHDALPAPAPGQRGPAA